MKRHLVLALVSLSLATVSLVLYSAEPGFRGCTAAPVILMTQVLTIHT